MKRKLRVVLMTGPLLLVLLAGCGGTSGDGSGIASGKPGETASSGSKSGGEAPSDDPEERMLQFTQCLREQGVDVKDVDPNSDPMGILRDIDPKLREKAVAACRQYSPANQHEGTAEEDKQQTLEFIQCLREQGVEVSDPNPQTGMPQFEDIQRFMNPDDEMAEAMNACADKAPQRLRR